MSIPEFLNDAFQRIDFTSRRYDGMLKDIPKRAFMRANGRPDALHPQTTCRSWGMHDDPREFIHRHEEAKHG